MVTPTEALTELEAGIERVRHPPKERKEFDSTPEADQRQVWYLLARYAVTGLEELHKLEIESRVRAEAEAVRAQASLEEAKAWERTREVERKQEVTAETNRLNAQATKEAGWNTKAAATADSMKFWAKVAAVSAGIYTAATVVFFVHSWAAPPPTINNIPAPAITIPAPVINVLPAPVSLPRPSEKSMHVKNKSLK